MNDLNDPSLYVVYPVGACFLSTDNTLVFLLSGHRAVVMIVGSNVAGAELGVSKDVVWWEPRDSDVLLF